MALCGGGEMAAKRLLKGGREAEVVAARRGMPNACWRADGVRGVAALLARAVGMRRADEAAVLRRAKYQYVLCVWRK